MKSKFMRVLTALLVLCGVTFATVAISAEPASASGCSTYPNITNFPGWGSEVNYTQSDGHIFPGRASLRMQTGPSSSPCSDINIDNWVETDSFGNHWDGSCATQIQVGSVYANDHDPVTIPKDTSALTVIDPGVPNNTGFRIICWDDGGLTLTLVSSRAYV